MAIVILLFLQCDNISYNGIELLRMEPEILSKSTGTQNDGGGVKVKLGRERERDEGSTYDEDGGRWRATSFGYASLILFRPW